MTDRTLALLEEVADFLDGYVDVKDGSDGVPQPNAAMLLKGDVDGAIARLKRSAGPARLELPSQLWLAQWFHDTYERLAPEYGYVTRNETRVFDPFSPNGKLMIAVCKQLREALDVSHATTREPSQ